MPARVSPTEAVRAETGHAPWHDSGLLQRDTLRAAPHWRRPPGVFPDPGCGHSLRGWARGRVTSPKATNPAIGRARRADSHPRPQRHTTQ